MRFFIIAIIFAFGLQGCTLLDWSKQEYAGLNTARATFFSDGMPKQIEFIGGKESGKVELRVPLPGGKFATFKGEDIRAFEAFESRRKAEEAIASKAAELGITLGEQTISALADAAVNAVTGGVSLAN